ncbi:hypothetical protein IQ07DRAFT_584074 [Pyrenochaeta sp. DS3sAY3a]|nr:hypothetical protein IQ07DRAFT_584074 [Pyrenochaeta sp. DS3sAY3a]
MSTSNGKKEGEDAAPPAQHQTYRQTAAAHIDTLNEINRQLPKMLTYFATALTQLTNNPIRDQDQDTEADTVEARQAAFRKYAIYVGLSVNLIREQLRLQIHDLEAHKVIPKSHPKYKPVDKARPAARSPDPRDKDKEEDRYVDTEIKVTNGGYGEFDVGVLNARASLGQVGAEEALDRVKAILEELKRRSEDVDIGEDMVVDG